jgi:hypothetical protein
MLIADTLDEQEPPAWREPRVTVELHPGLLCLLLGSSSVQDDPDEQRT